MFFEGEEDRIPTPDWTLQFVNSKNHQLVFMSDFSYTHHLGGITKFTYYKLDEMFYVLVL